MKQLEYKKAYYTSCTSAIALFKVQNFELLTTIYNECEILITILDSANDCLCILTFEMSGGRYNYNILQNNGITIAELEQILEEYIKQTEEAEW